MLCINVKLSANKICYGPREALLNTLHLKINMFNECYYNQSPVFNRHSKNYLYRRILVTAVYEMKLHRI